MKTAIEMARQAWEETGEGWTVPAWFVDREKSFERFAELVRADEREACAKVVEAIEARCIAKDVDDPPLNHVAAAIRARGQA